MLKQKQQSNQAVYIDIYLVGDLIEKCLESHGIMSTGELEWCSKVPVIILPQVVSQSRLSVQLNICI